jgi:hypothetical protein
MPEAVIMVTKSIFPSWWPTGRISVDCGSLPIAAGKARRVVATGRAPAHALRKLATSSDPLEVELGQGPSFDFDQLGSNTVSIT